ncbi:MAG: HI0074 family nucleotidyltransferase substrate-binding subunit [Geminicoccaceae bacterium]
MPDDRSAQALANYRRALARLEEALALPEGDPISRDAVILRFVMVYETAWKALQRCLALEAIEARYPKEVFRQAYRAGWLASEAPWIKMLEDRNLVAHTYNEATALRIHEDVKSYAPSLRQTLTYLTKKFGGSAQPSARPARS